MVEEPASPLTPQQGPDRYTRAVTVLKVALPLVALAMLSALFLLQTDDRLSGELVFSEADLAAFGSGLRISNATFDGTTAAGDQFHFHTALVVPDAAPPTRADLEAIDGTVDLADGREVTLKADRGLVELTAQRVTLTGAVVIGSSDGQTVTAAEAVLDLRNGALEARGGVRSTTAEGTVASETLQISPPRGEAAGGDGRRFSFGNGVRLRYDPAAAAK